MYVTVDTIKNKYNLSTDVSILHIILGCTTRTLRRDANDRVWETDR